MRAQHTFSSEALPIPLILPLARGAGGAAVARDVGSARIDAAACTSTGVPIWSGEVVLAMEAFSQFAAPASTMSR